MQAPALRRWQTKHSSLQRARSTLYRSTTGSINVVLAKEVSGIHLAHTT
jgi:hypothetical protein